MQNRIDVLPTETISANYLFDYFNTHFARFGAGKKGHTVHYPTRLKKPLSVFVEEHMKGFVLALETTDDFEQQTFWYRSEDKESIFRFTKKDDAYSAISFIGGDASLRDALAEFIKKNKKVERAATPKGSVFYLVMTPNDGPELRRAPSLLNFGLVEENYSSKVREKHENVLRHVASDKPRGKLAIYQGPPGTGKTYLIRHLISSLKNCYVILLQPSMVSVLADPNFLSCLMDTATQKLPIVFILEDADEVLSKREAANIAGISTLLNLGDGILGSLLDTRVICSTNAKIKEFDEAITRPGRLLEFVEVGNLSSEEALLAGLKILGQDKLVQLAGRGVEPDDFTNCKTIAEVYAQAGKYEDML